MLTFEQLALTYAAIQPAFAGRWTVQMLIPRRLGVSVDDRGCRVIFLLCPLSELAAVRLFDGMEHRNDVIIEGEPEPASALRISFPAGSNYGERQSVARTVQPSRRRAACVLVLLA